MKRGPANELTGYRYDVVLRDGDEESAPLRALEWSGATVEQIRALLLDGELDLLRVENARLARDVEAQRVSTLEQTAGELRKSLGLPQARRRSRGVGGGSARSWAFASRSRGADDPASVT